MDRRVWARLAVVPLIGGAGLVAPAAPAAVAAPAPVTAAAASELYVSNKECAPGGDGSMTAPFCTISAAAAVAQPGQTVLVQPGAYAEAVTFNRSGTTDAPITFRAVNGPAGRVDVGSLDGDSTIGTVFTVTGVHDVVIEGFRLATQPEKTPLVVDGSTRVTVDRVTASVSRGPEVVRITGGSSDVTISRGFFSNVAAIPQPAVRIDPGVTGSAVVHNQLYYGGLLATDVPGTVVTNNTVLTYCTRGIDVAGASPGVEIQNNVVRTNRVRAACTTAENATAIAISPQSTEGSVADYNLIDPISGGALYSWAGTTYPDLPSFRAATGQGGHDIAADPRIGPWQGAARMYFPIDPASPAVDSANAAAKGLTRTDMLLNPHSDNPAVANTGTGPGYHDRGAVEAQGGVNGGQVGIQRKRGSDPLAVTAIAAPEYAWPTDGEGGSIAYRFWDEPFWRVTAARTLDHSFRRGGEVCVTTHTSFTDFRMAPEYTYYHCTTVGALYQPVAPTRLLDTRAAVGTATTTPVAANSEIVLPIPSISGTPAADITAVVLNVTVTRPTAAGFISVYPDGDGVGAPQSSNVNFVAGETVPNLVTVPMANGRIRLRNTGSGTVHLVADLQGFYGRQGSGLKPFTPTRVLDTRTGAALAANGERRLDLSGRVPVDATAAILNVTVTKPTASGVLTVYPDGSPVPVASNLNFVAGQTIPNLVIVPVVAGKAMIRNASSGTTHVVADLAGYFGSAASGADQTYMPHGPHRIADSRNRTGWIKPYDGPFTKYAKASAGVLVSQQCDGGCPEPTAAVLNLTVTAPTAAGVLTAYPAGQAAPTASNVNFVAKETASNLAVVKVGADGRIAAYNNSSGSTHVVVDQAGYFIAPAS
ncbi:MULTISPECIES: right-handed parallel beta-helix repeat-containing protein [unclassified Micromonospora]|uniref:right-handed parallel beta-helix repeat-containing protein n=1 Tax=unclassified Micromonospora TaxID=2617518 RepID=UPI002FEF23DF